MKKHTLCGTGDQAAGPIGSTFGALIEALADPLDGEDPAPAAAVAERSFFESLDAGDYRG